MSTPIESSREADMPTLYLIDGSAYIYRAYHAIRGLSNSSGQPTNATFGFTRMLIKLMQDRSPEYVGMFFDAKGPTFRHERYADYKAKRPPMPDDLVQQRVRLLFDDGVAGFEPDLVQERDALVHDLDLHPAVGAPERGRHRSDEEHDGAHQSPVSHGFLLSDCLRSIVPESERRVKPGVSAAWCPSSCGA